MNALDRKLVRDLRHTWKMLLAVTSIIALGIACYIGMLSSARNLTSAQVSYYSTCRMADFWVDLKKAPVEDVVRQAHLAGISEIHTRIQYKVLCDMPGIPEPIGGLMISMPDRPTPVINGLVMRSGSTFTDDRLDQVIVSEKFANARGLVPGDPLAVIMNGQRRELVIVGTAISSEFVYLTSPGSLVDEPDQYGLFYIKRTFAEDAFGFEGACNSVVGIFTPEAASRPGPILKELSRRLEPYGVFMAIPRKQQFSHMTLSGELRELSRMAYMFPFFFLVVAALVLNVLITRLVEQQRVVIGTLKALGYGNRALVAHFLKYGAAAGIAGGGVGGALGFWLAGLMANAYLEFFSFPLLVNRAYPGLMLAGLALSTLICLLGALNGARQGVRLRPAEAMRPAAPGKGGVVLLERWRPFWRRLDIQWQMILREMSRRKGRTAIGIFSAAMGAAIVVLAFGFTDSMDALITQQFDKMLRSDYHLMFSGDADASVLDEIRRLPGVETVEPVLHVPCTFSAGHREKRGSITGISRGATLTVPYSADGSAATIPDAGLLLSQRLADQLGVGAGDSLAVTPVRGERRRVRVPVAGTFASTMGLPVYANATWLNRLVGESHAVTEARLLSSRDAAQNEAFLWAVKDMPQLESATNIRSQRAALERQFNGAMRVSAAIMIAFAAVIFFGSILNATLVAISERLRELATFGAIGYHQRELSRLFLRENMLINMTGTLCGLPLGYGLLTGTMQSFQTDAYSFPAALYPISFLYTLALAFIFILATQVVVIRNISRIDRVRSLSAME